MRSDLITAFGSLQYPNVANEAVATVPETRLTSFDQGCLLLHTLLLTVPPMCCCPPLMKRHAKAGVLLPQRAGAFALFGHDEYDECSRRGSLKATWGLQGNNSCWHVGRGVPQRRCHLLHTTPCSPTRNFLVVLQSLQGAAGLRPACLVTLMTHRILFLLVTPHNFLINAYIIKALPSITPDAVGRARSIRILCSLSINAPKRRTMFVPPPYSNTQSKSSQARPGMSMQAQGPQRPPLHIYTSPVLFHKFMTRPHCTSHCNYNCNSTTISHSNNPDTALSQSQSINLNPNAYIAHNPFAPLTNTNFLQPARPWIPGSDYPISQSQFLPSAADVENSPSSTTFFSDLSPTTSDYAPLFTNMRNLCLEQPTLPINTINVTHNSIFNYGDDMMSSPVSATSNCATSLDLIEMSRRGFRREESFHAMVSEKDPKPFKCSAVGCGKTFTKGYSLKSHLKVHSRVYSFILLHVDHNFKCTILICSPSSPADRPWQCGTCKKSFSRKHDLQRHARYVHHAKLYKCLFDGCQRMYKDPLRFRNHVQKGHAGLCEFERFGQPLSVDVLNHNMFKRN